MPIKLPDDIIISIHAPHARSDSPPICGSHYARLISIHAPHARSDKVALDYAIWPMISIHAPHARSDPSPMTAR